MIRRRWGESFAWLICLAGYGLCYALHAHFVRTHLQPGDTAHELGWLRLGGLPFVISLVQMNAYLLVSPQWLAALYLPAALLGLAAWPSALGRRVTGTVCLYLGVFAVVAVHDPEESSLLRRNEDRLHTGSPHPLDQVPEFLTGTNRRGTELHEPPDLNVVVLGQVLPSNASDDDRVVVRDRADRVRAGFQFSPHLSGARPWSAGRRGRAKDLSSDEQERTGPLGRQASLDPSGLPADEVVRSLEPELFEPPRGPRTHVSEVVVAVRDDRTRPVEVGYGFSRESLERDVQRAG